ncbi:hypothetical protein A7982_12857 [Minicystis rosea]|nr:hypothetical protein A7982_12857 [Minicystis rosea]
MKLPPFVSRLIARLAFLASLLFALGSAPGASLAAMFVAQGDDGALIDDDDNELGDDDVALHRHSHEVHGAQAASRRPDVGFAGPRARRAVPFQPAHRVTRASPRPPYAPLLRMLC